MYETGTCLDWDGVPSHIGIRANEKTDSAAKSTLDLPLAQVDVPYILFSLWGDDVNGAVANKLHSAKPGLHWICLVPRLVYSIMSLNIVSTNIFFPQVVLCRVRMGHTHLTHSNILIGSFTSVRALSVYSDSSPQFR